MELQLNPPAVRTLRDGERDRLKTLYPDLPSSPRDCLTCGGKGTFLWRVPGGEPTEWTCNCLEQFLLHRYLLNAGIDLSYQRLSWHDTTGTEQAARDAVNDYVRHSDRYVRAGIGLVLHGTKGAGKTLLATLLIKMLLDAGYDAYFLTFQELIDVYVSGWRNPEERAWFDARIRNAGVLGIDDVGRENKARVEMVESMFDHVLRPRVAAARPTIITTNKSLDELRTLYQGNVMSLLTESAINHKFSGEDYRPTALTTKLDEAKLGLSRPIVLM